MINELVLLEYEEETGCFHYNILFDGELDNDLFTNGYKPITVMNRHVADDKDFCNLLCDATANRYPYEIVVEMVVIWALGHPDIWTRNRIIQTNIEL